MYAHEMNLLFHLLDGRALNLVNGLLGVLGTSCFLLAS